MLVLNTAMIKRKMGNVLLATLGPVGTSSEFVARKVLNRLDIGNKELALFGTYEEAYECVKQRKCDGMIVANAYLIFKNQEILHSRDSFESSYNGKDRWLLRVYGASSIGYLNHNEINSEEIKCM